MSSSLRMRRRERRPAVLLVEGPVCTEAGLRGVMEEEGWEVSTAPDPDEGLAATRRDPTDAIVLELGSAADVEALVARFVAEDAAARAAVLVVVPEGDAEARARALEAGAHGHYVAPLASREILALVRAVVRAKRRSDDLLSRLRLGQRIAHVGTWEWSQVGDSVWWSDEVYRVLGRDPGHFVPRFDAFLQCVLEDDRSEVLGAIDAAMAGRSSYAVEHRIVRGDGVIRWVAEHGEVVADEWGNAIGMVGTVQDITARREAEEGLRHTTHLLRAVMAGSPVVLLALDRDGIISLADGRPLLAQGQPGGLVGRSFAELCHDVEDAREGVRRALAGQTVREIRRVGSTTLDLVLTPRLDVRGELAGVIGVGFDVTERQQLDARIAQLQRIEAVGVLAGGFAHDFNSLLTVIVAAGRLIERTKQLQGETADDLRQIITAATRAASLTQQLLAVGRRQVLEPEVVDVDAVLTALKPMLRRLVGADVILSLVCADGLPSVLVDRSRLEQVVLNLVINARDAMPRGGTLVLRTSAHAVVEGSPLLLKAGDYVVLEVSDTGTGMEDSVRAQIFQPFFTTKEPGRGTGLGLATCDGIVRQSGGAIDVESAPGQGSTFRVLLPAVQGSARQVTPVPSTFVPVDAGGRRVLVVDDDAAVRVVTVRCLELAGFVVVAVADGAEALDRLAEPGSAFDLVLTDVVMPTMSGPDFVRRARNELGIDVPVLFMSGYTEDTALRYGVGGAAGEMLLHKPFTPEALVSKTFEALGRGRSPGAAS